MSIQKFFFTSDCYWNFFVAVTNRVLARVVNSVTNMRVLETVKCGAFTVFKSKTPMLNQILKQTNCSVLACNGDLKVKDSMLSCLHMPILFSVPSRKTALGLPGDIATSFPDPFTLP